MSTTNLEQYQSNWKDLLSIKGSPSDHPRIKLYQDFVKGHYYGSIYKMFSRLTGSFNKVNWDELIQRYFVEHPPTSFELNHLTERFPLFLQSQATSDGPILPYFSEIASYEWHEFSTFLNESDEISVTQDLSTSQVCLSPVLSVLKLNYDVADWVTYAEENKTLPTEPRISPNLLAISRNPKTLHCTFTKLNPLAGSVILLLAQESLTQDELLQKLQPLHPLAELEASLEFLLRQAVLLKSTSPPSHES